MNRNSTELNVETITDGLKIEGDLNITGNFQINGTNALTSTTLGSNVVSSSLTSLGTLSTLTIGGGLTINNTNSHLMLTETDASNKMWHLEVNGSDFKIVESGVAERFVIQDGGRGTLTAGSSRPLLLENTVSGQASYLEIKNQAGTQFLLGCDGFGFVGGSVSNVIFGNWANGELKFFTNSTEQLALQADGGLKFKSQLNEPSASKGVMYYDDDLNKLRVHTGVTWVDLH